MDIKITKNKKQMTVTLNGKLDTLTAPELEKRLDNELDGVQKLILDFSGLTYISSAGLRVVMTTVQTMEEQGSMTIKNVCPSVMDVFKVTGLTGFLNIDA